MGKKILDSATTGLRYLDRIFMIDGYINDYALTYEETSGDYPHTIIELKPNKGYVADDGYIFIYYNKGSDDTSKDIPWFTVYLNPKGKPELQFYYPSDRIVMESFRIERVMDLFSIDRISQEADASVPLIDPEVIENVLNSKQTEVKPIGKDDDFLKRIIKTIAFTKGGDLHRVKPKLAKPWEFSNLMQSLNGPTKISPKSFAIWMSLLGCDFKVSIIDNGEDSKYPLNQVLTYSSETGQVVGEVDNHGNLRTGYQ